MAQAVVMPKLGQTVEEAVLVKWHKKEGDSVKKGEVLFEIETDKAVLEAESFYEGTLLKILVGEGETVPVSSTVAYVGKAGEAVPEEGGTRNAERGTSAAGAKQEKTGKKEDLNRGPVRERRDEDKGQEERGKDGKETRKADVAPGRFFISPRAKAFAREQAIDPSAVRGSGPDGRVVVRDIKAYLKETGYDRIRISPAAKALALKEGVDILGVRATGDDGRMTVEDVKKAIAELPKPMSRMRQVIAAKLTESFTTTPHFYVTVSVDMTDLLVWRLDLKEQGIAYSVTDFILKAVVLSLQDFPVLNSSTDGRSVRWHSSVDLGMAVGLEEGLVVPVIRNAEDLPMADLHERASALAKKARNGKLLPDEMMGSTFTVSNMGMLGVDNFTAIINPGESAILAVGSTADRVVVIEGELAIRAMMQMTLSSDHRIVDGATAAKFINSIKCKLEDMALWKSLML
jgi:pyruvate dehydrogenase E2 component (dihydrolipoamide acetyltransferase)